MAIMKLMDVYDVLKDDSWFDHDHRPLDNELSDALKSVADKSITDNVIQLVNDLYRFDAGEEDGELWVLMDVNIFRSAMTDAHREIIRRRNEAELAALDCLDGD